MTSVWQLSPKYVNKTCNVAVQVYVVCLRALCGAEGATSEDTCNTLRQVSDVCGELTYAHTSISVLLFMTNCSSDTKLTMLTTATPPRTTTPRTDWFQRNDPPKGIEYIWRYTDLHCVNADLSLFSTLHGDQDDKIFATPLSLFCTLHGNQDDKIFTTPLSLYSTLHGDQDDKNLCHALWASLTADFPYGKWPDILLVTNSYLGQLIRYT